jgi:hypothetical protein
MSDFNPSKLVHVEKTGKKPSVWSVLYADSEKPVATCFDQRDALHLSECWNEAARAEHQKRSERVEGTMTNQEQRQDGNAAPVGTEADNFPRYSTNRLKHEVQRATEQLKAELDRAHRLVTASEETAQHFEAENKRLREYYEAAEEMSEVGLFNSSQEMWNRLEAARAGLRNARSNVIQGRAKMIAGIEALEAENKRLQASLTDEVTTRLNVEAENKRLREALEEISTVGLSQFLNVGHMVTHMFKVARAALKGGE